MPLTLKSRIALAQLEAALIQSGVADHECVAVPLVEGDEPDKVRLALEGACTGRAAGGFNIGAERDAPESEMPEGPSAEVAGGTPERAAESAPVNANVVTLQQLYPGAGKFTHALAPGLLINVPQELLLALNSIKERLPRDAKKVIKPREVGFTFGIRTGPGSIETLYLRIDTAKAPSKPPNVEQFAGRFSAQLGMPVQLDLGMLAEDHAGAKKKDPWAYTPHKSLHAGMSVGSHLTAPDAAGATVTIPVRDAGRSVGRAEKKGTVRYPYKFITAAHAFHTQAGLGFPKFNNRRLTQTRPGPSESSIVWNIALGTTPSTSLTLP